MESNGWALSSLLQAVMLYRVQTNWSTNEVGLLGWSKHVGYTVLGYQSENVGKHAAVLTMMHRSSSG